MKNLIIAKRVVNNECETYIVYAKTESEAVADRMLFQTRAKAVKYAFILKKKYEAIITKAAMVILSKPKSAEPEATEPEAPEAPAADVPAAEPEAVEQKPAPKKRGRKPAAKKSNAEAL